MSVSAIPAVAKTLIDLRLQHRNMGQLIFTTGMVDDIAGWFLLSILSAMVTSGIRAGSVALALACLACTVLFAVLLGPRVVRSFVKVAAGREGTGPITGAVVVLILLAAAGTHVMPLEAVLGAFLCGIVLRTSGAVTAEDLTGLRTVVLSFLTPVFFVMASLRIDLTGLADPVLLGAAAILTIAVIGKLLGAETYTIIVLVAVVTSVMAPPLLKYAVARAGDAAEARLPVPAAAPGRNLTPLDRRSR